MFGSCLRSRVARVVGLLFAPVEWFEMADSLSALLARCIAEREGDINPKQTSLLRSLPRRLADAGVKSIPQLGCLLYEGAEQILAAAFPEEVGFDRVVVEIIEEAARGIAEKVGMAERLSRRASSGPLSDTAAVFEARAVAKKRTMAEEKAAAEPPTTRTALRARITWATRGGATSLSGSDAREQERWMKKAVGILEAASAPAFAEADRAADPVAAKRALLGAARASTIRLRVRTWEPFARWLAWHRGYSWPMGVLDMIDYVHDVMANSPVPSFPRSFAAALAWFEARAGFGQGLAGEARFRMAMERAQADVGETNEEVARAPRLPTSIVAALEVAVVDSDVLPSGLRVIAWCRLLKVYGVMRTDDLKRMHPKTVTMGEAGFQGRLMRTKTTGPGKKVKELMVFVPVEASITGVDWLRAGYDLWQELAPKDVDFFIPRMAGDMDTFTTKVASSQDLIGMFSRVLVLLRVPVYDKGEWKVGSERLTSERMAMMWTGHSERSTLPSLAATVGMSKEERDHLGRWSPTGSDEYVRTARVMTRKAVAAIMDATRKDNAYHILDEAEAFETVSVKMAKKGASRQLADHDCKQAKANAKMVLELVKAHVSTGGSTSPKSVDTLVPAQAPRVGSSANTRDDTEEEEAKYVVSVARRRSRARSDTVACLHSRAGCYRGRGLVFDNYELILIDPPPVNSYNVVCRSCWPSGTPVFDAHAHEETTEDDGASSTSSSSE